MTADVIAPGVEPFPDSMIRVQGDYEDIWGPERRVVGRAQRWLREKAAIAGLGSLGNRFADPQGRFKETYTARSLSGALVELWASDVPDEAALNAATRVHQARFDAPFDPYELPRTSLNLFVWTVSVKLGRAGLDVRATETRTWLRRSPALSGVLARAGVDKVLASGVVEGDGPKSRIVTQAISRHAYMHGDGFDGIVYRSRHGNGEDAFAVFDKVLACVHEKRPLDPKEAAASEAARRLGLYIEGDGA